MSILRKIKLKTFKSLMKLLYHLRQKYAYIPISSPELPQDLKLAINIDTSTTTLEESPALLRRFSFSAVTNGLPSHEDLFYIDNKPLPCVIESDYKLSDNWLRANNNYPFYFNVYSQLCSHIDHVRMFEIGVRTGYQAVVFARACKNKTSAFYMGIDPNLYVNDGLNLANKTLQLMRNVVPTFQFTLVEGYSWENNIQKSALYSSPFDIIHIDGDHSLQGKLIDLEFSKHLLARDGVVLVDDFDHHPIIKDAVKKALSIGWFKDFLYIKTFRGLAVLQ